MSDFDILKLKMGHQKQGRVARLHRTRRQLVRGIKHALPYPVRRQLTQINRRLPKTLRFPAGSLSPLERAIRRLSFGGLALLIVLSVAIPLISQYQTSRAYRLSAATMRLVGDVNKNLSNKITYDAASGSYYFNKAGIKSDSPASSPAAALAAQTGGSGKKDKSLYSVKMPNDPRAGITYYDDNLGLSFTVVPQIKLGGAQEEHGRIVYAGSGIQDVFTTKGNGLKDDIVLTKPMGDKLSYSYKLNLPNTLEAKLIDDTGEVGIYSADPALYNNITFGSNADQTKVMAARQNGAKTNLVFVLPAPSIKQYDAKQGSVAAPAVAHFSLKNNTLTVHTSGLAHLSYPITIDPSVVTTSTSDFATGNNEDNIDYSTANQINRGALTGGSLNSVTGSWGTTTSLPTGIRLSASVAYNGYLYVLGGQASGDQNSVQYAAINSNGTIGSWGTTTAFNTPRDGLGTVAYNGYLYILGGFGGSNYNDVQYAPINANGTVGAWTATTSFTTARSEFAAAVYGGYLYVLGGSGSVNPYTYNDVQYAPINANGTVGAWTATTSLISGRYNFAATVYNGYVYVIGGDNSSANPLATVQYAPINANGTIGTWATTTSFKTARDGLTATTSGGYVYVAGGSDSGSTDHNDVQYAPINANGTIGTWATTTSFSNGRHWANSVMYNGYAYMIGGCAWSGTTYSDVQYAKIDPAGTTSSYTTASNTFTTVRDTLASVTYNGYLYVLGGFNGSSNLNDVQYAPINSDGSLGTWHSTNSFSSSFGLSGLSVIAYNNYIYVLGGAINGSTNVDEVVFAPLNADGTVGTWQFTYNSGVSASLVGGFTTGRENFGAAAYNGYLYILGGYGSGRLNDVQYAPINANGTIGTWQFTYNSASSSSFVGGFTTARDNLQTIVANGYIYVLGGYNGSTPLGDVQYAKINANGTIGTWQSTASITARYAFGAVVNNGYLYVLGGTESSGSSNDVQYALINSDGTIGTWQTNTTLSVARKNFATVSVNGYLYVMGGYSTGRLNDTQYAQINNGGSGTAGSWNTNSNALPSSLQASTSVAYNGYIYVLGGYTTSIQSATYYAPLNTDGSIGTWVHDTSSPLPQVLDYATSAVYNGYVYVLGGYSGAAAQASTYYAPINADGSIGTWQNGAVLPQGLQRATSAVWGGYIYELGGYSSAGQANTYYAPLNNDGSIGTWVSDTSSPLPQAVYSASSAVYNGYVYEIGGIGSTALATVYYAPLNSNGSIGTWATTAALPQGLFWASSVVANGYIYELGGSNGSYAAQAAVYYAPINANGTIGGWASTTALPQTSYWATTVAWGGYIYQLGGEDGGSIQPTVYYAPLNAIARVAHYSKLIDLGGVMNVSGITYDGTVPNGLYAIKYMAAGANGVFGTASTAASLNANAGASGVCATGGVSARYVWVGITLDDSGTAAPGAGVFPDSVGGNNAQLTDFTVNYSAGAHPLPQQRLRLGQTLQTGVLSPLDTCGA